METGNGNGKAITVSGLSKSFGEVRALNQVSFDAVHGELVAFIGPNGAGKTTLLKILAGALEADTGEVDVKPTSIGWVPQHAAIYDKLSVAENLRLFARLEELPDVEGSVELIMERMAITEKANEPVENLSGGNRQRVNIGIGLLTNPQVLILDEPTESLDPQQRDRTWRFVQDLAGGGTTILFSTHNIEEAEHYADRVVVLANGDLIFLGTPEDLWQVVATHRETGEAELPDFEAAFVAFLKSRGF